MDCIFCGIVSGKIPSYKVYEDNHFIALLDINPLVLGHTLIIPKTHLRNIFDTPEDICKAYYSIAKKVAKAISVAFQTDGINILQSNEQAAGQTVFHAHLHVIPRYADDKLDIGATKRIKASPKEMLNAAEKIRSVI